jgi:hypothetical protein
MDPADPCPHVAGALQSLAAGYKAILRYDSNGFGGGDDAVHVRKFWITTLQSFNPTAGDNVHLTLRNNVTGQTLYNADFVPANWVQPNPLKKKWVYSDPTGAANGAEKALLKEPVGITPVGSNFYKFRLTRAENLSLSGALSAGQGVDAIVEIEQGFAGICFAASADACLYNPLSKDVCLP